MYSFSPFSIKRAKKQWKNFGDKQKYATVAPAIKTMAG